ncbi:Na+/H+ antiporter NhaC family protein [Sulfuriroseicoccus oceanibius]|uniref:Na+/H+ antiporter NhaC-like C-terminal domain-containing protein n=1 Tax=Sulfuriroseicoccus oceanibius TaxID=2707525 RepID=A0A6B3LD45_9BACT|nr:Na+/H+ antiporter NhaC family protein [Sulfuriroseicoccus oceanibius]QQL44766.1 hypothetical protein G3M56_012930 [Sulfuriroseicoccus oceanibius]
MKRRIAIVSVVWAMTWLLVPLAAGWTALWPSVVALVSVFLLNRSITGLLLGASAGLLLLAGGNPMVAVVSGVTDHLWPALTSTWNLSVLAFTLLLGGFAALLEKGGGLQALTTGWLRRGVHGGRHIQLSAYLLGLICFFDGLANSMLVGKSISPMAEKVGVSRQKLAYIVDSTSSAVACVAVISTWIAYQLSMIREGLVQADVEGNAFALFLRSIPFNFYCWFTLILLMVVILRGWDIGPMKKFENAERPSDRALDGGSVERSSLPAVVPIGFLIIGLLVGLYLDGAEGAMAPFTLEKVSAAFGNANAALVLVVVSLLACVLGFGMNFGPIRDQGGNAGAVFLSGVRNLLRPVLILVSAWLLSSTLKGLEATDVLSGMLQSRLNGELFPLLVFVVGALISFSTGTSWGTMGILMPLALPVALGYSGGELTGVIHATIAAVFSGAVFGDHCSPFSDTTIVSSVSCGVEPMDHVRTQLPYAMIAAIFAVAVGFLPAGFGWSPYAALGVGAAGLVALPVVFGGRRTVG